MYSVYIIKCELGKFWVGFTKLELNEKLDKIRETNIPYCVQKYKPLEIISIKKTENLEDAKNENIYIYETLAKVLGYENVAMDERRYKKMTGKDIDDIVAFTKSNYSKNSNNVKGKYVTYCLLCAQQARYIGMTKTDDFLNTIKLHTNSDIEFTKWNPIIKVERKEYSNDGITAKMYQSDFYHDILFKKGKVIKIYTEFIDSKDTRTVWEDIISPKKEELFENTPSGKDIDYWVYILECEDLNYYVGYTSNLRKRFEEHSSGSGGSNYTYKHKPKFVLYIEGHADKRSALNAEREWTLDLKTLKGTYNVSGYTEKNPYTGQLSPRHDFLERWQIKHLKAYEL